MTTQPNPENVPENLIGYEDGWRLLEDSEKPDNVPNLPFLECIERLKEGRWVGNCRANQKHITYRTKLTRAELRRLRNLPPDIVPLHEGKKAMQSVRSEIRNRLVFICEPTNGIGSPTVTSSSLQSVADYIQNRHPGEIVTWDVRPRETEKPEPQKGGDEICAAPAKILTEENTPQDLPAKSTEQSSESADSVQPAVRALFDSVDETQEGGKIFTYFNPSRVQHEVYDEDSSVVIRIFTANGNQVMIEFPDARTLERELNEANSCLSSQQAQDATIRELLEERDELTAKLKEAKINAYWTPKIDALESQLAEKEEIIRRYCEDSSVDEETIKVICQKHGVAENSLPGLGIKSTADWVQALSDTCSAVSSQLAAVTKERDELIEHRDTVGHYLLKLRGIKEGDPLEEVVERFLGGREKQLESELEQARSENDRMRADKDRFAAFAAFAVDIMSGWPHSNEASELQETATKHGLLIETTATQPCGEGCMCQEYDSEFPTKCYQPSVVFRAAIDKARAAK